MKAINVEKNSTISERNFYLIKKYISNTPILLGLCFSVIMSNKITYDMLHQFRDAYAGFMVNSRLNSLISENPNIGLLYFIFILIHTSSIIIFFIKKPVFIIHVSSSIKKTVKTWCLRLLSLAFSGLMFFSYYIFIIIEPTCTSMCLSSLFTSYANNFYLHGAIFLMAQCGIFMLIIPFFSFPVFCRK